MHSHAPALQHSIWKVTRVIGWVVARYNTEALTNQRTSREMHGRVACSILLSAGIWLAAHSTFAQQSPTEYQVKAAYLFNFLKFVEWPEETTQDPQTPW